MPLGYEMKTESTRYLAESEWGILDYYGKQAAAGALPLGQAQTAAKEAVRQLRF